MTYLQLYLKYQTLPPVYQAEVADFIDFLAARTTSPDPTERKTPIFGSAEGQFRMRSDFNAPLDDFADYQ